MVTVWRYARGDVQSGGESEGLFHECSLPKLKLRLQEFLRWTKMVNNSLVFCDEALCDEVLCDEVAVRTHAFALGGQAATAEEAALHAAL
jgi:hypothetical protein